MGVFVSVDDFGTGYSSISYLRRCPIDKLKIDRSFINILMTSEDDESIVRAIISLAHGMRIKVVAEGVENADQVALLQKLGCDQYQGFYFSPPVPASAFEELMRARDRSKSRSGIQVSGLRQTCCRASGNSVLRPRRRVKALVCIAPRSLRSSSADPYAREVKA